VKRTLIAALLIAPMSAAMAARDNVGCGLGSQIFDGQQGVGPQVLAVTTNNTLGNQTFGISSGTLGCEQGGVVTASAAVNMFVGSNLDSLSRDMAVGQGESLESLAQLMGIEAADRASFYNTARANYGTIFPAHDVNAGQVLDGLYTAMANTPNLARYVRG
jgi:hypothetical protein